MSSELSKSRDLLNIISENMVSLLSMVDINNRIVYASPSHFNILGYSIEELIGRDVLELVHPDDFEHVAKTYEENLKKNRVGRTECRYKHKDGFYVWIETTGNVVFNNAGDIEYIIFNSYDISKLKTTERNLENTRKMYQLFIETGDAIFWIYDLNKNLFEYVSNQSIDVLGYAPELWYNDNKFWENKIYHIDKLKVINKIRKLYKTKSKFEFVYRMFNSKGELTWIRDLVTVVYEQKVPCKLIGLKIDITQRKNIEENYKLVFENNPLPMYIYNLDTLRFLDLNKAAVEQFGYTKKEVINSKVFWEHSPEQQQMIEKNLSAEARQHFSTGLWKDKKKNGEEVFVQYYSHDIKYHNYNARIAAVIDITKNVKAEEQRNLIYKIISSSKEAIYVVDKDRNVVFINDAFCELYKVNRAKIKRLTYDFLFPEYEIADVVKYNYPIVLEKGYYQGFINIKTTDGNIIPVFQTVGSIKDENGELKYIYSFLNDITKQRKRETEVIKLSQAIAQSPISILICDVDGNIEYINPMFLEASKYESTELIGFNVNSLKDREYEDTFFSKVYKAVKDKTAFNGEFLNKSKSGDSLWEQANISPIKDENGIITHFIAFKENVHERKNYEEAIRISLKEKETLLKEIHHRVKNNLQVISSLLSLQSDYIQGETEKELFNESKNRIRSMGLIHERLYQSQNLSSINYSDYIKDLVNHLFRTYNIPTPIKINFDLDLVYLSVDYAIPCGLIINELVSNVFKYATKLNLSSELNIVFKQNGNDYLLIVGDNGPGLPSDINFRNTNSLGLQLVTDLVEQIEGNIELVNDHGAIFKIMFKRV